MLAGFLFFENRYIFKYKYTEHANRLLIYSRYKLWELFILKSKLFLGNTVISKSCNVDQDMLTHSICIRTSATLASCIVIYYATALYKIVKFMYSWMNTSKTNFPVLIPFLLVIKILLKIRVLFLSSGLYRGFLEMFIKTFFVVVVVIWVFH